MRTDGRPLPNLAEAHVLLQLQLLTTSDLPGLAARWLAEGLLDSPSARMLAAHDRDDPWGIDGLLAAIDEEAEQRMPAVNLETVAADWVVSIWSQDGDTWRAVRLLAEVAESHREFEQLQVFDYLAEELDADWGRSSPELRKAADQELADLQGLSR